MNKIKRYKINAFYDKMFQEIFYPFYISTEEYESTFII